MPVADNHIVSQEALAALTERSFYDPHAIAWTPEAFVTNAPNRLPTKEDPSEKTMDRLWKFLRRRRTQSHRRDNYKVQKTD